MHFIDLGSTIDLSLSHNNIMIRSNYEMYMIQLNAIIAYAVPANMVKHFSTFTLSVDFELCQVIVCLTNQ